MSHSTNSNVKFCDVCDLSIETKKGLYRHQSYDSKHEELLEKIFGSDDEASIDVKPKAERFIPPSSQPIPESIESVYDSEEENNFLRPKPKGALPLVPQTEIVPKDNNKDNIKTKHITKPETKTEDSIYSKIKFRCEECNEEFKNKITLTTHSYSHNGKYLKNTEYFDINSSQIMKKFYNIDKAGNYIEDIDEAINNSLEETKNS